MRPSCQQSHVPSEYGRGESFLLIEAFALLCSRTVTIALNHCLIKMETPPHESGGSNQSLLTRTLLLG